MDANRLAEIVEALRVVGTDGQAVEVKSGVGKSIVETISAFANTSGGAIIVGLSEEGGMTPVPRFDPQSVRSQLESRLTQVTPIVRADIDIVPFEDASLVVATIPELLPRDKPCYVTTRGTYAGSYIRVGMPISGWPATRSTGSSRNTGSPPGMKSPCTAPRSKT